MARTVGSVADGTRQRILDAAADLFIEQGYAGTSVRDISERMGMTKGSLYYHFASKEDVLNALVTPLIEDLDAFISDASAVARADAGLIERLVDLLDRHGVLLRSLMSDPSVLHNIAMRRSAPQRLGALERALGGATDAASVLRGRCALGLINSATLAPRFDTGAPPGPSIARQRGVRTRLGEAEKRYVVAAALAVLDVPGPA